ncbi:hypothetical protein HPB51_022106 [Rhipicephalus microplus]|uniref:VWFA domain-containing protein n=1 Tax=Rhipicephalus microplus TaxID=6941 RepID=A0A9J6EC60_RHIMP|nr:hypothetical protein HPB51_022106 [Rhipicephalus microplus]
MYSTLMFLQVLNTRDETPEGGIIVLMSDGEENEEPKLNDVLPEVTAAKVEVSSMALGASADRQIEKLASRTGGKAFSFQDLQGNMAVAMETAFVESTTTQAAAKKDYVTHGKWTIRVDSAGSQKAEVNIQVKSQGKDPNSEPIRVNCRMGSLQVGKPDEAIIYADVYKGKKIVLDATVIAEVTGPNPPHKSMAQLYDNGHDPDIEADDGTYSGYFVHFTGKGRYVVTAHVSSDHRARVSDPKVGSGSFYSTTAFSLSSGALELDSEADYGFPTDDFEDDDSPTEVVNETSTSVEPAGAFQRVAVGGSFR